MIWPDYPLWYILGCEGMHFLFSACAGFSAFSLTLIMFSSERGSYTRLLRSSLLVGLSSALLAHVLADWWGAF